MFELDGKAYGMAISHQKYCLVELLALYTKLLFFLCNYSVYVISFAVVSMILIVLCR